MKTLPKLPYIQNIVEHFQEIHGHDFNAFADGRYQRWLTTLGFTVPVHGDYLEFPDDFPDSELTMFMLKWS